MKENKVKRTIYAAKWPYFWNHTSKKFQIDIWLVHWLPTEHESYPGHDKINEPSNKVKIVQRETVINHGQHDFLHSACGKFATFISYLYLLLCRKSDGAFRNPIAVHRLIWKVDLIGKALD